MFQKNPMRTVPYIEEDGFCLADRFVNLLGFSTKIMVKNGTLMVLYFLHLSVSQLHWVLESCMYKLFHMISMYYMIQTGF